MTDREFTPGRCANCDSPDVTFSKPLYCSEFCREMAKHIRYIRGCRADGRVFEDDDVAEAIQVRIALLIGGGYGFNRQKVSPDVRYEVIERAGGRCERCGRVLDRDGSTGVHDAMATLQHVAGPSNDASNLQAFCMRCNMDDAESRFVPVEEGSAQEEQYRYLEALWSAPTPSRLCYDHENWSTLRPQMTRAAKDAIRGLRPH